ncbi:MAG: hypothetical protein ACYS8Z_08705 [Planctomycetota bacterium]|jgi:hypothetical protein
MRINEIEKMIKKAVAEEKRSGRLKKAIEQTAKQNGLQPNAKAVNDIVKLVREYVEHVPFYLKQGSSAAQQMNLGTEMGQMLQELENYWFEVDDLMSDHLGLMGLMDDAYATLLLLQALSDYCQASFGRPLLPQNLTVANQGMRQLIGDQIAAIIEQRVGVTIGNAMMQKVLEQVTASGFAFPAGPDPVWGNASIDEVVNARLGALGIF